MHFEKMPVWHKSHTSDSKRLNFKISRMPHSNSHHLSCTWLPDHVNNSLPSPPATPDSHSRVTWAQQFNFTNFILEDDVSPMPVPTNHKSHPRIISWALMHQILPTPLHSTPYLLVTCDHLFAFLPFPLASSAWFSSSGGIPISIFNFAAGSAPQIDRVVMSMVAVAWLLQLLGNRSFRFQHIFTILRIHEHCHARCPH